MQVSLEVSKRAVRPRSLRKELRHKGKIPAVVNGYNIDSTPISIDAAEFGRLLRENGLNTVIGLTIDGQKVNTLIHHYTADTFTGKLTHVEFLSVNMTEETEVEAEVVLVGEAAGVNAGGTLTQNLYTVLVSATPAKLPDVIEVDISSLEIGDAVTIADLPTSADYTIVTDAEEQIAAVTETYDMPVEEGGEAVEPEVIGEEEE